MVNEDFELRTIQKRFKEYYNSELRYEYEELEQVRTKYLRKFKNRFCLSLIVLLVYVGCCFNGLISKEIYAERIIYLIYFVIVFAACAQPVFAYKRDTKFAVMDKILMFFEDFSDVSYFNKDDFLGSLKEVISTKYIREAKLYNNFTDKSIDDAFKGKYHNTEIKISEQVLGLPNKNKIIFEGVLIALRLEQKYEGNTVCYGLDDSKEFLYSNEDGLLLRVLMRIVCFFQRIVMFFVKTLLHLFLMWLFDNIYLPIYNEKLMHGEQVKLEDVVFSKKWNVYADDQVEARYVLTPALMERMLAVKKLFHGNKLDFSFWGNNLLIAVHTSKDMFETTSLFKSALDYRKVQEVICQLYSVFTVIDVLKLQGESKKCTKKES